MTEIISDLRINYEKMSLDRENLDGDPFAQFRVWFGEAVSAGLPEPNAMSLATVDQNAKPSVRMVLLKGFDERGLTFFTNYKSRKGVQLENNPQAAVCFHWQPLERQVRVEGKVEKISERESLEYFKSRPYESQIAALASKQSGILKDRQQLEELFGQFKREYPDEVPLPRNWGGYRIVPDMFEFWQGRPGRMHDRFEYRLENGAWTIRRLSP